MGLNGIEYLAKRGTIVESLYSSIVIQRPLGVNLSQFLQFKEAQPTPTLYESSLYIV